MDYKKAYDTMIARAKNRELLGYSETHHILPRSLGGTDDKSNLVKLTGREHLVAHLLLVKMQPIGSKARRSMVFAVLLMTAYCTINSHTYEKLRKELAEAMKGEGNHFFGRKHSQETKDKISAANRGRPKTERELERLREFNTGRKHTPEAIRKMKAGRGSMGTEDPSFKGWWECEGVRYTSMNKAAKGVGCSKPTIKNRVNNPNYVDYRFIPKGEEDQSRITAQKEYYKYPARSGSKTGVAGVSLKGAGYTASVTKKGKQKHLYQGKDFFEACCRRKSAELKLD